MPKLLLARLLSALCTLQLTYSGPTCADEQPQADAVQACSKSSSTCSKTSADAQTCTHCTADASACPADNEVAQTETADCCSKTCTTCTKSAVTVAQKCTHCTGEASTYAVAAGENAKAETAECCSETGATCTKSVVAATKKCARCTGKAAACTAGCNDFERLAKLPYVIEPPDVLIIGVKCTSPESSDSTESNQPGLPLGPRRKYVVAMDGQINLGPHGPVYIAGMTPEQATKEVTRVLSQTLRSPQVDLTVHRSNSKVAYLVVDAKEGGDNVIRVPVPFPLTTEANVGSLLAESVLPQPVDFADAKIAVARPAPNGVGAERVLPVSWDESANRPTEETNYPVLPGDRIFVKTASSFEIAADVQATPAAPACAGECQLEATRQSQAVGAQQVMFHIAIIEDAKNNLAEIKPQGHGVATVDAETLSGTLRILEKNNLIRRLSEPRLVTTLDRKAKIAIESCAKCRGAEGAETSCGQRIEVSARQLDAVLCVSLNARIEQAGDEQCHGLELAMEPGETALIQLRTAAEPSEAGDKEGTPAVYIVLTPTLVK